MTWKTIFVGVSICMGFAGVAVLFELRPLTIADLPTIAAIACFSAAAACACAAKLEKDE